MKKRKILTIITVFIFAMVFSTNTVKADQYNGSGTSGGSASSSGGCPTNANALCPYGNSNDQHKTIKLTIQWCKNGVCRQIGNSEYWSTKPSLHKDFRNPNVFKSTDEYDVISEKVRKYFDLDKDVAKAEPTEEMVNFFKRTIGDDWKEKFIAESDETNPISQPTNKVTAATYGFRIFIEPVWRFYRNGNYYFYTVKEAAKYITNTNGAYFSCTTSPNGEGKSCNNAFLGYNSGEVGFASLLTVDWDDVGISKTTAKSSACYSGSGGNNEENMKKIKNIAETSNGCGWNIIDITMVLDTKKCYTQSIEGGLTCVHNDRNNESDSFKELYTETECSDNETTDNGFSEYGKTIAENDNCTLYCSESAFASFPGGISTENNLGYNLTRNSYFAWPARYADRGTYGMQMFMTSTYTCRIVEKSGRTCSSSDISTMVSSAEGSINKLKVGAKLTGGNYNKIDAQELVIGNSETVKKDVDNLKITDGKTEQFNVSKKTYLEILTSTNRYYNKSTGAVSDSAAAWLGTYVFDRGQGVISLSEKYTDVNKEYELKISDVVLGDSNQFGKRITDYTCKYSVEPTIECYCPEDSLYPGNKIDVPTGSTCIEMQKSSAAYECYACIDKNGKAHSLTSCIESTKTGSMTIAEAAKICEEKTPECGGNTGGGECQKPSESSDGQYHCKNGNVCTKEQYDIDCPKYYCKIVSGKYYCKNGETCTKAQYDIDCEACKKPSESYDENYHCKNGSVCDKAQFDIDCPEENDGGKCQKPSESTDKQYHCKDGKVCTKEQYDKDCPEKHSCEYLNGKYYCEKGNVCTESQYNAECKYYCEIRNGNYYCKNGSVCNKSQFDIDCEACKKPNDSYDGNYHCKNGSVCTKEQYDTDCPGSKHYCEIINGNYYCKNGEICNKTQYDNDCPENKHSCEIINGNYYCKNGEICNKTQYDNDCPEDKNKKCDDPNVTQDEWDECMNNNSNNYDYCDETLCNSHEEGPRCERVPLTTWETCRKEYNYTYCYYKYCYDGCKDCKYTCKTLSGTEIDISKCISDRQAQLGESFKVAKRMCSDNYCPSNTDECENGKCPKYCEGDNCTWTTERKGHTLTYIKTCDGKVCLRYPVYCPNDQCLKANNVIYRTIDLNNPFPGGSNGKLTQFSNDGLKGRLPSSNWNSVDVVKEKILNARNVKGYDLYKLKPLYTIELTPAKIKEIREYNKKVNNYSDFKLSCKNDNNSGACISSFLHTTIYSAIDRNNSVANCYNMSNSEAGFNACYNRNN